MTESEKLGRAVKALENIVERDGRVCEEFELCKHPACQSSVASWLEANEALREIQSSEVEEV